MNAGPAQANACEATAAVITPSGRGAVAVIVVEGRDAAQLAGACFQPAHGAELASRSIGRVVFGRWGAGNEATDAGDNEASAVAGEEVVACRRSATRVEIHCHGGTAAAARILDDLAARGAELVDWRVWRLRGDGDPIAAEADLALAQATTERTARILLDQRQGALRAAIESAIGRLVACEHDAAAAAVAALLDRSRLGRSRLGRRLVEPWRIVLAGRPNVGKSSLINRLVGYERAIVFDQPGTTRDVVTAATALDGWPCELADTAGLCESDDALERAGVERALAALRRADLVVLVEEATCSSQGGENGMSGRRGLGFAKMESGLAAWPDLPAVPVVCALSKCDLAPAVDSDAIAGNAVVRPIRTSAKTGEGIGELAAAIVERLVPRPPAAGEAVPFIERHTRLLESAAAALAERRFDAAAESLREIVAGDASG